MRPVLHGRADDVDRSRRAARLRDAAAGAGEVEDVPSRTGRTTPTRPRSRALARQADATGFFYMAVWDHLAVTKPIDEHMQTTWYDTVATLGWLAGDHRARAAAVARVRARVPAPAAHREVVHDARRALGRARHPRRRRRPPRGRVRAARRSTSPSRGAHHRRRDRRHPRRVHRRVPRHRPPRASGTSTTRAWRRARARPGCRSGSAARRRPALRRAAERGDGWLPQGTPRAEMPGRSRSCSSTASRRSATSRSTSARSPSRSTSATPAGTSASARRRDRPSTSPSASTSSAPMGVSHVQVRFRIRVAPGAARPDGRVRRRQSLPLLSR